MPPDDQLLRSGNVACCVALGARSPDGRARGRGPRGRGPRSRAPALRSSAPATGVLRLGARRALGLRARDAGCDGARPLLPREADLAGRTPEYGGRQPAVRLSHARFPHDGVGVGASFPAAGRPLSRDSPVRVAPARHDGPAAGLPRSARSPGHAPEPRALQCDPACGRRGAALRQHAEQARGRVLCGARREPPRVARGEGGRVSEPPRPVRAAVLLPFLAM
jgi:hypothetical protein